MGAMDGFKRRIIASDGGPGHFKVYKTQYWMSVWNAQLRAKHGITFEWNMYFSNLGHNLCDGHAGKLKVYGIFLHSSSCFVYFHLNLSLRQVREAEGNYQPMVTAEDVIRAVGGKLSNTIDVLLEANQIHACDEDAVKAVGKGFIRKYHHFTYPSPGVVSCRYIKGEGPYVAHKMIQGAGVNFPIIDSSFSTCCTVSLEFDFI